MQILLSLPRITPDVRDRDGHTALWYAVKYERKSVAMALRKHRGTQLLEVEEVRNPPKWVTRLISTSVRMRGMPRLMNEV